MAMQGKTLRKGRF